MSSGRMGLCVEGCAQLPARTQDHRHHPGEEERRRRPETERLQGCALTLLRCVVLQGPQRGGTVFRQPQAMAECGHPVRQTRRCLPGGRDGRRGRDLAEETVRHALVMFSWWHCLVDVY